MLSRFAKEEFCETTIGAHSKDNGQVFYKLFNTPYFRVTVISDSDGVEICGALKNIVAFAVGVCKGFRLGSNTKAAVIRIGMMEIIKFARMFYKGTELCTVLESCGVADLMQLVLEEEVKELLKQWCILGRLLMSLKQKF